MGHASQRRRSGGGITPLNHIISAVNISGTEVRLTYARPIDGSQIVYTTFTSNPTSEVGDTGGNVSSREIEITFSGPIGAANQILYEGATPGILTPQTFDY